jgi:hypothetical protein
MNFYICRRKSIRIREEHGFEGRKGIGNNSGNGGRKSSGLEEKQEL